MSTDARLEPAPTPHQRPWTLAKRNAMSERISALWGNPQFRTEMRTRMREGHKRKRLAQIRSER